MSHKLTQDIIHWADLETGLWALGTFPSSALSEADKRTLLRTLILNCMVFWEDLLLYNLDARRDLTKWLHVVTTSEIDVVNVANLLKKFDTQFLNLKRGESAVELFMSFKQTNRPTAKGVGDLLAPLKGVLGIFDQRRDPHSFKLVHQFLCGWTRVNLSSLDHSASSLEDYLAIEQRLANFQYDTGILEALNGILKEWFPPASHPRKGVINGVEFPWFLDSCAKHGPGGVADISGHAGFAPPIREKYQSLCSDQLLDYFCGTESCTPFHGELTTSRTCKVIFVAKSLTTWRTISMEPVSLMRAQQSVMSQLQRYIAQHRVLSRHIHLRDDHFNTDAAQLGSRFGGNTATIDLSSASDCVSWKLVKTVFRSTSLLRALWCTRTTHGKLPKVKGKHPVLKLNKYAPMGSALSFPIECIVFAAIVELAVRRQRGRCSKEYLVYGDDITCDTKIAGEVVSLLEACGFIVNRFKSFYDPAIPFRESCGGEFYEGYDVTPFRIGRKFVHPTEDQLISHPSLYKAGIGLINSLLVRNLRVTRAFCLQQYLQLPLHYRPLFGNYEGSLTPSNYVWTTGSALNHHLAYEPDFDHWGMRLIHYGEVSIPCVQNDPQVRSISEEVRLYEWLRVASERKVLADPLLVQVETVWQQALPTTTLVI